MFSGESILGRRIRPVRAVRSTLLFLIALAAGLAPAQTARFAWVNADSYASPSSISLSKTAVDNLGNVYVANVTLPDYNSPVRTLRVKKYDFLGQLVPGGDRTFSLTSGYGWDVTFLGTQSDGSLIAVLGGVNWDLNTDGAVQSQVLLVDTVGNTTIRSIGNFYGSSASIDGGDNLYVAGLGDNFEGTNHSELRHFKAGLLTDWTRTLPKLDASARPPVVSVDPAGFAFVSGGFGPAGFGIFGPTTLGAVDKVDRIGRMSDTWADTGRGVGVRAVDGWSLDLQAQPDGTLLGSAMRFETLTGQISSSMISLDRSGKFAWSTNQTQAVLGSYAVDGKSNLYGLTFDPQQGPSSIKLQKLDSTGQVLWQVAVPDFDRWPSFAVNPAGDLCVVGLSAQKELLAKKFDTEGKALWTIKRAGPSSSAYSLFSKPQMDAGGNVVTSVLANPGGTQSSTITAVMISEDALSQPQVATSDANFRMKDQGIWAPGVGGFDVGIPLIEKAWNTGDLTLGGYFRVRFTIPLVFTSIIIDFGEFGGRLLGRSNGVVGLGAHAKASGGALNANYPLAITLQAPGKEDPGMRAGQEFTVKTSYSVDPSAAMSTDPASLEAYLGAYLKGDLYGNVSAKAFDQTLIDWTFLNLETPGAGYKINYDYKIFDSRDYLKDGRYRADFDLDGLANGYVTLPQIRAHGTLGTGADGQDHLTGSGSDIVFSIRSDLTNLITRLFGIPTSFEYAQAVSGGEIKVGGKLLQATAQADLSVVQDFDLKPGTPSVKLVGANGQALSVRLPSGTMASSFPVGTDVKVLLPTGTPTLTFTPVFFLASPSFTNKTRAVANPSLGFDPLSVNASASALGYKLFGFSKSFGAGNHQIPGFGFPLFTKTFAPTGFADIAGQPITIVGNSNLPELRGTNRPYVEAFLYNQDGVGQPSVYPEVQDRFSRFATGTTDMLLFGKLFDSSTQIFMTNQGRRERLSTSLLNSNTLVIQVPNRELVLPGIARLSAVQPGLGESNSVDFPIRYPAPNVRTVGPSFWASDPEIDLSFVTVIDGKNARGNDTFIARRDYFLKLEKLWSDTFPSEMDLRAYFPSFDFNSAPQMPTIVWDGKPLLTYGEPVPSGLLWSSLPKDCIRTAQSLDVYIVAPGPGGGPSRILQATIAAPKPVVSGLLPATVIPGTAAFTLAVKGPANVEAVGDNSKRSNFNPDSVILINGQPVATTFVSSSELHAEVPAGAMASAGAVQVQVSSPSNGTSYFQTGTGYVASGGTSASAYLQVRNPMPAADRLAPSEIVALPTGSTVSERADFDLVVQGTGFVPDSVVRIQGVVVPTHYVSDKIVEARIPLSTLMTPGQFDVIVQTPNVGQTDVLKLVVNARPKLAAVTTTPQSVVGGTPTTGKVTLSGPAPAGGFIVQLSSSGSTLTVPDQVVVPVGAIEATFAVSTAPVEFITEASITAGTEGVAKSGTVRVLPPPPMTLSISPTELMAGQTATGTVRLTQPADKAGVKVTLSSSSSLATVPGSVTVKKGATTVTFSIATKSAKVDGLAEITAKSGATTSKVSIKIVAPTLASLSVSPASVVGGKGSVGKVTLVSAAPAGGLVVTLTSSDGAVTVPAVVVVPAGATSTTFAITTVTVTGTKTATLSAVNGPTTKTATLSVKKK